MTNVICFQTARRARQEKVARLQAGAAPYPLEETGLDAGGEISHASLSKDTSLENMAIALGLMGTISPP